MSPVVNPDGTPAEDEPESVISDILTRRASRRRAAELAGRSAPTDQVNDRKRRRHTVFAVVALAAAAALFAVVVLLVL